MWQGQYSSKSADLYVAHIFTFSKWGNCWHPNFFDITMSIWDKSAGTKFSQYDTKVSACEFSQHEIRIFSRHLAKIARTWQHLPCKGILPEEYWLFRGMVLHPGRLTHKDMILWGDWLTKILYDHCGDLAQKVDFIILLGDWPVRTWSRRIRMMKNTGGKNLAGLSL